MKSPSYPVSVRCLGNGLRVVVSPRRGAAGAGVCVVYDAGLAHEGPGQAGVAHLVEHLMFEGSRGVAPGEHGRQLAANGGSFNAVTEIDYTAYFTALPAAAVDLALWLEADRMATMPDAVTPATLDAQRGVLAQECHCRGPAGGMTERLAALMYPAGHPYSRTPAGRPQDVAALTAADVRDFHAARYAPARAVLAVAGDVLPGRVAEAAERYFGPVPAGGPSPAPPAAVLGPLPGPARDDRLGDVPHAAAWLGWRLPPNSARAPDLIACDLAMRAAARRVRRAGRDAVRGCAPSMSPRTMGDSAGVICVEAMPGVPAGQAGELVTAELEQLARGGPAEGELAAVQAGAVREVTEGLANAAVRAAGMAHATLMWDDPALAASYPARIRAATPAGVRVAARQWLRPSQAAIVTTSPAPGRESD